MDFSCESFMDYATEGIIKNLFNANIPVPKSVFNAFSNLMREICKDIDYLIDCIKNNVDTSINVKKYTSSTDYSIVIGTKIKKHIFDPQYISVKKLNSVIDNGNRAIASNKAYMSDPKYDSIHSTLQSLNDLLNLEIKLCNHLLEAKGLKRGS